MANEALQAVQAGMAARANLFAGHLSRMQRKREVTQASLTSSQDRLVNTLEKHQERQRKRKAEEEVSQVNDLLIGGAASGRLRADLFADYQPTTPEGKAAAAQAALTLAQADENRKVREEGLAEERAERARLIARQTEADARANKQADLLNQMREEQLGEAAYERAAAGLSGRVMTFLRDLGRDVENPAFDAVTELSTVSPMALDALMDRAGIDPEDRGRAWEKVRKEIRVEQEYRREVRADLAETRRRLVNDEYDRLTDRDSGYGVMASGVFDFAVIAAAQESATRSVEETGSIQVDMGAVVETALTAARNHLETLVSNIGDEDLRDAVLDGAGAQLFAHVSEWVEKQEKEQATTQRDIVKGLRDEADSKRAMLKSIQSDAMKLVERNQEAREAEMERLREGFFAIGLDEEALKQMEDQIKQQVDAQIPVLTFERAQDQAFQGLQRAEGLLSGEVVPGAPSGGSSTQAPMTLEQGASQGAGAFESLMRAMQGLEQQLTEDGKPTGEGAR